jgi:hypothetical protein
MNSLGETLKSIDAVGPEKALGVFVAAVRAAVPDAPPCYFDLMSAEDVERRRLQRQCEAHFKSLPLATREAIRREAIVKAQEIVQSPFERLAASLTSSMEETSLDDLFPK